MMEQIAKIGEIKNEPYLKKNSVQYRKYQEVIAEKCVGRNSLVVLPTGLGKTIIAILVSAKILSIVPLNSKIVVMAPTRPLIDQHYKSFTKTLSISEENFTILTGKIPPGIRTDIFREHNILFFTPQTLRNDLVNERYSLSDVCLLIFDEAHHSSGDYPYSLIAEKYTEQNSDGTILALTASPGATKKKIVRLCESLRVPLENIHIRSRKDNDVKLYLKPMDVYKIGVKQSKLMEDTYLAVNYILEERLQYLYQLKFISDKSTPLYKYVMRKDLLKLNSKLIDAIKGKGDKTGMYSAISINAQALILFHMLELIEQQGLDILLKYLEKLEKDAKKKSSSKAVKRLAENRQLRQVYIELKKNQEFSPENLIHPKYHVLEKLLIDELGNFPDSRILIFVKLRNSVNNIVDKLNGNNTIRAVRFVGQATKSSEDKGLSQKQQVQILEQFKEGVHNVLVGTNVAEEGLDIAECDLVVFYDVVTSEIRMIQRKGRTARHRKGKVIILYCENTRDEIYLRIALNKLKKMNVNLKNKQEFKRDYSKQGMSESDIELIDTEIRDVTRGEEEMQDIIVPTPQTTPSFVKKYSLDYFANKPKNEKNIMEKKIEPCVRLSKDLPMKLGLRKRLTNHQIPYSIVNSKDHLVINGRVIVQICEPKNVNESRIATISRIYKLKYNLVIIIFDFIDFKEEYDGEKRLLKRTLLDFGDDNNVQVVCIDNYEELFFLTSSLYEHEARVEE